MILSEYNIPNEEINAVINEKINAIETEISGLNAKKLAPK